MAAGLGSVLLFLGLTLLLVVLSLPLFFLLYLYHVHKVYDHIPGPKRDHFVLGHLRDLERKLKKGTPTYDRLFEYSLEHGPVTLIWLLHRPIVIVSSVELVKEVLITANLPRAPWLYKVLGYPFHKRFLGRGLATEVDHDVWQGKRSALNPAFHRKFLKELIPQFNSSCDAFLEKLFKLADGKTEVKMGDEFNRVTLDVLGKVAFGIDLNTINDPDSPFPAAIKEGIKATMWILLHPLHTLDISSYAYRKKVKSAVQFLRDFGKKVIDERKKSVQDGDDVPSDILSYILKTAEEDPNTSVEYMIDEFITFFIAGQETTSGMLAYLLVEVGQQQEIEERLVQEAEEVLGSRQYVNYEDLGKLHYTGLAIKEALRLHPTVPVISRVMPKDGELGGHFIPAGTDIQVNPYAMHRHPKYWKEPEKFRPERFEDGDSEGIQHYAYLPFSSGPHTCIGQTFAQFEAKVLISRFLKSFKFELLPDQNFKPEEPKTTLSPADGVKCTLTLQ